MKSIKPALAAVVVWSIAGANGGTAQLTYAPNHAGSYAYRLNPGGESEPPATTEELTAIRSQLRQIAEAIHATPMLQSPKGVDITARAWTFVPAGCPSVSCAKARLSGWLNLAFEGHLLQPDGKVVVNHNEPPGLAVAVNDPANTYYGLGLTYEGVYDTEGNEIFMAPAEVAKLQGFAVYEGDFMMISRNGRPVWIPVSNERYLRGLMKNMDSLMATAKVEPERDMYRMIRGTYVSELDSMTAAERTAQAYVGATDKISRLVARGEPGAAGLMRFNPAFFDNTLPRSAVQLITLRFNWGGRYDERPIPLADLPAARLYQLYEALDYKGLALLTSAR